MWHTRNALSIASENFTFLAGAKVRHFFDSLAQRKAVTSFALLPGITMDEQPLNDMWKFNLKSRTWTGQCTAAILRRYSIVILFEFHARAQNIFVHVFT